MNNLKAIVILFVIFFFINDNVFSREGTNDVEKEKKFEIEFSVGAGRMNPASIYTRASGLDSLIDQYARYYQLDYSSTGEFTESKLFIPFNISGNYLLNDKFYLKAGVDYCFKKASPSEKAFQVAWDNFTENHEYILTDKISYLMPHIGIGFRRESFDFYGALGMGFARFTHTEELDYSEPGYSIETTDTFKVKGTGLGAIFGIKYRYRLNRKSAGSAVNAFVKVETVLLKVNALKGSKVTEAVDSDGVRVSQTLEGTLYAYDWNPYGVQRFDFWDLYGESTDQGFEKLSLNLSGFRLMIGISF
jgi:hypothetical protein